MSENTQLDQFEPAVWERLERIVEDFEDQWQSGECPKVADFLKRHGTERQALLTELLHVDVEYRVRSNKDIPFDHWMSDFPDLRANKTLFADLVAHAYSLTPPSRRFGNEEELIARFPDLTKELSARLAKLKTDSPPSEFDATAEQPDATAEDTTVDKNRAFQSSDLAELVRHTSAGARFAHDRTTRLREPARESADSTAGMPVDGSEIPASLRSFGDYQLEREVARGGMGVVYAARQVSLNRLVALKMIRSGCLASDTEVERFRREANAAGGLRHPGIVAVHDVGEIHGLQYFSMDLIDGHNLADRLQHGPVSPDEAAKLMREVALAVDHAHANGVLHRDLKPSNILIDSAGQPHITDFGLARRAEDDSGLTMTEQALGTPSYMPPEQISRRFGYTLPQSDVYSLGATLFEMLTGRPPFVAANNLERVELILNQEPPPLGLINSLVPVDLETICQKCLRKEQLSRYGSAGELADDLLRFINREPISARRTSRWERTIRWCRRRPALAAAVGTVAMLLCVILVGSPIAAMLLREERDRAISAERMARSNEHSMRQTLFNSYLDEAEAVQFSRRVGQRFQGLDSLQAAGKLAATLIPAEVELRRARNLAVSCMTLPDLKERHRFEVDSIHVALDREFELFAFCEQPSVTTDEEEFGKSQPVNVQLRSVANGRLLQTLQTADLPPISTGSFTPEFSRDGEYLFLAGSKRFQVGHVWKLNLQNQDPEQPVPPVATWQCGGNVVMTPDSRWIIQNGIGDENSLQVHDLTTGRLVATWKTTLKRPRVSVSPLTNRFSVIGSTSRIRIYAMPAWMSKPQEDIDESELKQQPKLLDEFAHQTHHSRVYSVAWSDDGRFLSAGTSAGGLFIWDTFNNRQTVNLSGHRHTIFETRFSPDASQLFSSGWDGNMRVWDTASTNLLLHTSGGDIHLSTDGSRVASVESHEGTYNLVVSQFSDAPEHRVLQDAGQPFLTSSMALSGNGDILASSHIDGLRFWNVATGSTTRLSRTSANGIVFDPVLQQFIAATENGVERLSARLVDGHVVAKPAGALPGAVAAAVPVLAISDDAQTTAAMSGDHHVLVWDKALKDYRVLDDMRGVEKIDVSPSGKWVATYGSTRGLVVVDLETGERHNLMKSVGRYLSLAFSPDGQWLVSGERACYRLWSTSNWKQEKLLPREGLGTFGSIAHSSDGRLFAVAHSRSLVRIYDARSFTPQVDLSVESQFRVNRIVFSKDNTMLAVSNETTMIHLWDLEAIQAKLSELGLNWKVTGDES
jgi:eukaryotic-like serine/threonine-protein kinase